MGMALQERDLRAMSDLLDVGPAEGGGLPEGVLRQVGELVPADDVTYAELDLVQQRHLLTQELVGDIVTRGPVAGEDPAFWSHYWSSPACSYPSRTGDERTVTMLSDFCTPRQWHSSGMYVDVLGRGGVEHELMCSLPGRGSLARRLMLFRSGGPAFTERDRLVLALLRPHLAELMRPAASTTGLTTRQEELLRLVAAGCTTREIAEAFFLSPATVRKHMENILVRLGVTNRTAAVVRAFGHEAAG